MGEKGGLVTDAKSTVDILKVDGMTKALAHGIVSLQIDEPDFLPPTVHFTTVSTDASNRSLVYAPNSYLRWLVGHRNEQMGIIQQM